jgi:hypothetical protein
VALKKYKEDKKQKKKLLLKTEKSSRPFAREFGEFGLGAVIGIDALVLSSSLAG